MKTSIITAIIAICTLLALPSCEVIGSAITGQDIPASSVQRTGQPQAVPILVSSADLALAEQSAPGTIHGLYNAGYLATKARQTVIEATK